jgi:saccharopine dehydrogenase-like NADP-dependent oxidoreductase
MAMKQILVLGGGAQGRVIAADLARALPDARIRVADVRAPRLPRLPNLDWVEADLSSADTVARLLRESDMGVGALPSRLGLQAMKAAIEARRNLVDVSFTAEDPLALDAAAHQAGVTIVPDCGLAPGLSNLLVGRALAEGPPPDRITILVGGVAQDASQPYGYVVTWSLDDLVEEYVRPARIVANGETTTVPVFSGLEELEVDGVGTMEAFYSDGLRTLLDTVSGVREMGEKTLRWPGHARAVRPLVAAGRLVEELREKCAADPPQDLVALVVRIERRGRTAESTLVDRYDPLTGLSAMSRTTALTTAAMARLAAQGGLVEPGVRPLELLGRDARIHRFVLDIMSGHGVRFSGSLEDARAGGV